MRSTTQGTVLTHDVHAVRVLAGVIARGTVRLSIRPAASASAHRRQHANALSAPLLPTFLTQEFARKQSGNSNDQQVLSWVLVCLMFACSNCIMQTLPYQSARVCQLRGMQFPTASNIECWYDAMVVISAMYFAGGARQKTHLLHAETRQRIATQCPSAALARRWKRHHNLQTCQHLSGKRLLCAAGPTQ